MFCDHGILLDLLPLRKQRKLAILCYYCPTAPPGANTLGIVLVTLNECPMKHVHVIGLFCWADLSAKTSPDWQEEVIRSHRNIPQLVIARA